MHQLISAYHAILSRNMPAFMPKYLQAPEMQRLGGIGLLCGTDYSRLYAHRLFYSRLDHSLAAARIVWHFTGDKAQALAALFHDIATPVFSHSVDFMKGDAATQTATESLTHTILAGSQHIMACLAEDGLSLDQVDDYHRYPIADNDSPRLSSDRLEYTLSSDLAWHQQLSLTDIQAMYDALQVLHNEEGEDELGFTSLEAAEQFVSTSCRVCTAFLKNDNKLSLQYLGDLLRLAIAHDVVTEAELFTLTEAEVICRFEKCKVPTVSNGWDTYTRLNKVHGAAVRPPQGYAIGPNMAVKRRYINPLVLADGVAVRTADVSTNAREQIDTLLAFSDDPVGYIEYDLM